MSEILSRTVNPMDAIADEDEDDKDGVTIHSGRTVLLRNWTANTRGGGFFSPQKRKPVGWREK